MNKNNTGLYNSGNRNSGDFNSGYYNNGDLNSGYFNSGNRNSGHYNSGDINSGYLNSGYYNSGYYNSGNRNSGDYNSGDYNSGYYNSGDFNSGWFNTDEPKMRFFNKESEYTFSEFLKLTRLYPNLKTCSWIEISDIKNPTSEQTQMGGYLKTLTYKEAWAEYWNRASEEDKKWFQSLPNFSWEIFTSITGITPEKSQEVEMTVEEICKVLGKTIKIIK